MRTVCESFKHACQVNNTQYAINIYHTRPKILSFSCLRIFVLLLFCRVNQTARTSFGFKSSGEGAGKKRKDQRMRLAHRRPVNLRRLTKIEEEQHFISPNLWYLRPRVCRKNAVSSCRFLFFSPSDLLTHKLRPVFAAWWGESCFIHVHRFIFV